MQNTLTHNRKPIRIPNPHAYVQSTVEDIQMSFFSGWVKKTQQNCVLEKKLTPKKGATKQCITKNCRYS